MNPASKGSNMENHNTLEHSNFYSHHLRNMRVLLILGTVLLFTLVFADHHEGHHEGNDDHKDGHEKKEDHHHNESLPYHKIADYNSIFSFDLYRHVALNHPSENIVFSPVSISTAFAFLSLGAKAKTRSQIIEGHRLNTSEISEQEIHKGFHNLLDLLNDVAQKVKLSGGNALFISKEHKILQTFLDEANKFYHSEVFSTDFKNTEEAKNQINSYVEKNTNGKIPELLNSVDHDAIVVLISYIYFKGNWQNPFDEKLTQEGDFHVNEKTTVKVPFMDRTGHYNVSINDNATMVSIPYKGGVQALFILPKEGKLSEIEQNYNKEAITKMKKSMSNKFVQIHLPKFSASGTMNLKETLSKLGIEDVFSDKADLSGITGEADMKVTRAIHKAVLNVNEQGTEGAGATALEMTPMMLPVRINFNRPFIVIVTLKSRILFTGRISNPQE